MDEISIGIIGFGTVGSGTFEILTKNEELIAQKVGARLKVKKIADLDITSDRGIDVPPNILTTDINEILNDDDITIVVELIGGSTVAFDIIKRALTSGKHVVTANKALIAERGESLYKTAAEHGTSLAFEASVGGAIPIIGALRTGLAGNRILSFKGILNGTSNYILSRMTSEGLPYEKVLAEATALGYAETPPDLDVEGYDTAHKVAVMASIIMGAPVEYGSIYREGITFISDEDIFYAKTLGYSIKLLGIARIEGRKIEAKVHPVMLPLEHILANVNDVFNAVYVEGDFSGPTLYYGKGAGRRPTASAVAADLLELGCTIRNCSKPVLPLTYRNESGQPIELISIYESCMPYYLRFSAVDSPGVLSKISGVLADNNISIYSVIQKGRNENAPVPIVMLTHEAREKDMRCALDIIDGMDFITEKTIMIRVDV